MDVFQEYWDWDGVFLTILVTAVLLVRLLTLLLQVWTQILEAISPGG
jgi:hypothetical protein